PDGPDDEYARGAQVRDRLGGVVAMICDRRFDMEAARAYGLLAVGVTWGFGSRDELRRAGADVLVDRPAELAAALRAPRADTPRPLPRIPPDRGV
ncbi:MAG: HAD hydrolase-like protein, partial [Solirubrobacteraceae bacterium]